MSGQSVAVVDGFLDGAERLIGVIVQHHAGCEVDAGADVAGIGAVGVGSGAVGIRADGVATGERRVAAAKVLVGQIRLIAIVGRRISSKIFRIWRMSGLLLDTDVVFIDGIAINVVVGAFDDDTEAVAGAGLLITGNRIVFYHHAGRYVDIARDQGAAAEYRDGGNVAQFASDADGAHDAVVFHHDAAGAGFQAGAVGHFNLDAEATVVGKGVVGNDILARAGKTHGRHAAVGIVVHIVVGHGHPGGSAVLEFDAAAVVVVHLAVLDGDVGFGAIPDHDTARAAGVVVGDHPVYQHIVHVGGGIDVDTRIAGVIPDFHILYDQVVVAIDSVNSAIRSPARAGVVFHRQFFYRHIGNTGIDGYPPRTGGKYAQSRTVEDGECKAIAVEGQRFVYDGFFLEETRFQEYRFPRCREIDRRLDEHRRRGVAVRVVVHIQVVRRYFFHKNGRIGIAVRRFEQSIHNCVSGSFIRPVGAVEGAGAYSPLDGSAGQTNGDDISRIGFPGIYFHRLADADGANKLKIADTGRRAGDCAGEQADACTEAAAECVSTRGNAVDGQVVAVGDRNPVSGVVGGGDIGQYAVIGAIEGNARSAAVVHRNIGKGEVVGAAAGVDTKGACILNNKILDGDAGNRHFHSIVNGGRSQFETVTMNGYRLVHRDDPFRYVGFEMNHVACRRCGDRCTYGGVTGATCAPATRFHVKIGSVKAIRCEHADGQYTYIIYGSKAVGTRSKPHRGHTVNGCRCEVHQQDQNLLNKNQYFE
ncbi:MAG: hypothetical protein EPGJADBJ_02711 [Saprospiraceae bacterium]|nr:hypothetical protein [Saprospiraceae bacterium]